MSKPTIARLSVKANDYSVESLKVTLAVNEVPIAALTVLRKSDEKLRRPMSEAVVTTIRERQQKRLAGFVAPDMVIEADDGMGGKLNFVGYQTVPVVEIGITSTTDSFVVLGVDGMLEALDLSYYCAGYNAQRGEASYTGSTEDLILDPIPGARDGKVTQLISNISQVLIKNYEPSLGKASHPTMKALITQQHNINVGLPINLWLRILANSNVAYEAWEEAYKTVPGMGIQTSLRIAQILQQKVGGFWSIANSLMSTFQMYYVPNPAESGKFVRADTKVADTSTSMELSVSNISVSDGNHRLLPIGGVVMMRPAAPGIRAESSYPEATNSVAAQYPKQLLTGFVQREMPPLWLLDTQGSPIAGSDLDRPAPSAKLNLSIPDYLKRKGLAAEQKKAEAGAGVSILDELCEVMFKEMQLAHSTAVATIPLDYTRKVGERVVVKILSGGSFTAFVNRIIHSVDLRQGKELNSFTQISFTHVRY